MKRIYWLMAVAGFLATLAFILGPLFVSGSPNFTLPGEGAFGLEFVVRYYLLALVFFAIITVVLSGMRHKEDAHTVERQFILSFIGFTLGSWFASILFLIAVGLAWSGIHPTLL